MVRFFRQRSLGHLSIDRERRTPNRRSCAVSQFARNTGGGCGVDGWLARPSRTRVLAGRSDALRQSAHSQRAVAGFGAGHRYVSHGPGSGAWRATGDIRPAHSCNRSRQREPRSSSDFLRFGLRGSRELDFGTKIRAATFGSPYLCAMSCLLRPWQPAPRTQP